MIIFLINFGCNKDIESDSFVLPKIINSHLDETCKRSLYGDEYLSVSKPICIGKFKFGQLVDVNPEILFKDTTYIKDFISNKHELEIEDNFDYNGFDLVVDYSKDIFYRNPLNERASFDSTYYCYYPVYFVNSTTSNKLFPFGLPINAVQEVKKKGTLYYAIEVGDYNLGCGNGTGGIIVKPKEYVLVLMKKYKGKRESEIRVRFEIGPNIYVSKPFLGKINPNQFQIEEGSLLQRHFEDKEYWHRFSLRVLGTIIQKQRISGYDFPSIDSLILPKNLNSHFKENDIFWSDKFYPIDIVVEESDSSQRKYDYQIEFAGLEDFDHISKENWEKYLVSYIKEKKIKLNGTLESNSDILNCRLILDNEKDLISIVKLITELLSNHREISNLVSKK